jgi:hypothetical protein
MLMVAHPMALGFAALACTASPGFAAPPNAADTANVLGTYECHTGSAAAVLLDKSPVIEQRDRSNPGVRITVSSLDEMAKVGTRWWDAKERTWKERPRGAKYWVKRVDFKDTHWVVVFDGVGGDLTPASAMLSKIPSSTRDAPPRDKHVFSSTWLGPVFATASIFNCDKL